VECGTATTIIHGAPSWWVPVGVVGSVFVLALVGFIVAVNSGSGNSGPPAAPPAVSTTGLTSISEWPQRLTGWTVVLAHTQSEAAAYAKATKLSREGVSAGVIDSTHHPGWLPGYWIVFSGRYPTAAAASAAATALVASGYHGAHPKLVAR
jgi:hypothetical protein